MNLRHPDDMPDLDPLDKSRCIDMDENRAQNNPPFGNDHADDVAAASAAYLYNVLPAILQLDPPEAFRRLAGHFRASIDAYRQCRVGWLAPDPSAN